MDKYHIVPDLVDKYGPTELCIRYAEQSAPLQFGQHLRPSQVAGAPTVTWRVADPSAFYTLIMTDPDAPSRRLNFLGEVRHWLVANIPGCDVASGDTLWAYIPSGPPPLTGSHRYVFLLFEQSSGRIEFAETPSDATSWRNRFRTSTREFASRYKLGNPIAANVFLAKH